MCETCRMPEPGRGGVARAAKIQWALVVLVTVGALVAGVLGGNSEPERSVTAPDRVFRGDMARQADDANRLVAQAAGSPRLEELAQRIERVDRGLAGRNRRSPAAERTTEARTDDRALRDAIRRHVVEDRIIAQIGLETGSSASTRRAAAELLRASRDWTVPPRG